MSAGDLAYLHVIVLKSLTHDSNFHVAMLFMVEVQSTITIIPWPPAARRKNDARRI